MRRSRRRERRYSPNRLHCSATAEDRGCEWTQESTASWVLLNGVLLNGALLNHSRTTELGYNDASAMYSTGEQRGWYMYDFANSAFSTTVVTLFLGPYLTVLAKSAADAQGFVHPLGLSVDARSYWSYMVSLSVILQVIFLPVAGALADYGRNKKEILAATAYFGAAATMAMFFLEGRRYLLGGGLFLIANVSFGAAETIYNSFLPEIAPPEERDAVSSKGFGIGYLGGGLLLALNLLLYLGRDKVGISESAAVRISLCSAGTWWAVFTIPTLLALHNRGAARVLAAGESAVRTVADAHGRALADPNLVASQVQQQV